MIDAERFDRMWAEARGPVAIVVSRLARGRSREDREDLIQSARAKAWAGRERHDPSRAGFTTWACMIARNLCLDADRKARRLPIDAEGEKHVAETLDAGPSPHDLLEAQTLSPPVLAALDRLTKNRREAILMAATGDSSEDCAAALGITPIAFRHRLHGARKRLRAILGAKP